MRCERVRFLYDEYSQGTLPVSTLSRVEEHLAACPSCRDQYDQNDTIADVIRKSAEVAHPGPAYFEDLHSRVLAALDEPETRHLADPAEIIDIPSTQWRRPLWWVGGVAAAALLAVSLVASRQPEKSQLAARLEPQPPKVIERDLAKLIPPPAPPVKEGAPANGSIAVPAPSSGKFADLPKGMNAPPIPSQIPKNHYGDDGNVDRNAASAMVQQERERTEKILVDLRRRAVSESEALPPEVFKQLQLLKTQIIEGGNEDLRRSLRDLEFLVNARISDQDKISNNPLVKQANKYLEANDCLSAGRTDEAMAKYRGILFVDEHTPVAIKAALQMADLFYSEWANFKDAREYYNKCTGKDAKGVLSKFEEKHVKSQLDRLERYKANDWQALELLNKVHHGKWNEVRVALKNLIASQGAGDLLPEAARTILMRMDSGEALPSDDIALDLYKILEKQAKVEQNVDVRAWLELALGDMAAATQFQDTHAAINHYGLAAQAGSSDAAIQARAKLKEMENENWAELVRNRK